MRDAPIELPLMDWVALYRIGDLYLAAEWVRGRPAPVIRGRERDVKDLRAKLACGDVVVWSAFSYGAAGEPERWYGFFPVDYVGWQVYPDDPVH